MAGKSHANLSRRERQIMDVIYAQAQATAAQVAERVRERMGGLAQGLGIDLSALGFPDGKP